jgi:hypothetical protein
VTNERGTPGNGPTRRRRTRRKRSESEVDRAGLASVVGPRVDELADEGVTQAEIARNAECAASTIRNMQYGKGDTHYSNGLLSKVSISLGFPEGRLVEAFYPRSRHDSVTPPDAEFATHQLMTQLAPYLAKIDAIPELQADVATIKARLDGVVDAIQEVKDRVVAAALDITRPHPTE